jgi:hypothetical protein
MTACSNPLIGAPGISETRAVSGFGGLLLRPAPKQVTHEKSTGRTFYGVRSGAFAAPLFRSELAYCADLRLAQEQWKQALRPADAA